MQEAQVGWDPVYVHRDFGVVPKLFVIYLFFTVCVYLVRSAGLFKALYFGRGKPISPETVCEGADEVGTIAASALANKYMDLSLKSNSDKDSVATDTVARTLTLTDTRFAYLWNRCYDNVQSLRRLVWLTLLFSLFVTGTGLFSCFQGVASAKSEGIGVLGGALQEVFMVFAWGLFVCVLLYGASSFFEGALARRRTNWDYFRAKLTHGLMDQKESAESVR